MTDKLMDTLFKLVAFGSFGILAFIVYRHVSQKNTAASYAHIITKKIEHGGG